MICFLHSFLVLLFLFSILQHKLSLLTISPRCFFPYSLFLSFLTYLTLRYLSHSLSLQLSLYFYHFLPFLHSHILSFSPLLSSQYLSLFLPLSILLSFPLFLSHTISPYLSLSLSHTIYPSLSLSLSLTISSSLSTPLSYYLSLSSYHPPHRLSHEFRQIKDCNCIKT